MAGGVYQSLLKPASSADKLHDAEIFTGNSFALDAKITLRSEQTGMSEEDLKDSRAHSRIHISRSVAVAKLMDVNVCEVETRAPFADDLLDRAAAETLLP